MLQEASGKSVVRYCREAGIAEHVLSYWKSKFKKQPPLPAKSSSSSSSAKFIAISSDGVEEFLTITAPSGLRVKVPVTMPGEKLLELVQCLVR